MTLLIKAISHIGSSTSLENSWNDCVSKLTDNPFLLSGFLETFMELNLSREWGPLFLLIYSNDELAGLAPLMMKKKFGTRIASFILKPYNTPDFLIDDRFRTECIARILDFLFQTLHCKLVDLTFPAETENLYVLEKQCETKGVYFSTEPYIGHRILPVEGNWGRYEAIRGGNFRRRFRKMERRLNEAGSLRVSGVEGEQNESEVYDKIIEIEKASWKEKWRVQEGVTTDPELSIIWKGAGCVARTTPEFKRVAWLLELNDHPLAYAIVLQYKQTAIIAKTSYDVRYRRFYPGMYIINAAVRALFSGKSVSNIDYLTDMPFMDAWTTLCRGRVRVLMGRGVLPTRVVSLCRTGPVRTVLTTVLNRSPIKVTSLLG